MIMKSIKWMWKIAFLNGELKKKRYIWDNLKAFIWTDKHNLVCKLNKSLYGVKQSPWVRYAHVNTYLLQNGFE
jgi:hypothetical protein